MRLPAVFGRRGRRRVVVQMAMVAQFQQKRLACALRRKRGGMPQVHPVAQPLDEPWNLGRAGFDAGMLRPFARRGLIERQPRGQAHRLREGVPRRQPQRRFQSGDRLERAHVVQIHVPAPDERAAPAARIAQDLRPHGPRFRRRQATIVRDAQALDPAIFFRDDFQPAAAQARPRKQGPRRAPHAACRGEPKRLLRSGAAQPVRRCLQAHAQFRGIRPRIDRHQFQIERHADPAHTQGISRPARHERRLQRPDRAGGNGSRNQPFLPAVIANFQREQQSADQRRRAPRRPADGQQCQSRRSREGFQPEPPHAQFFRQQFPRHVGQIHRPAHAERRQKQQARQRHRRRQRPAHRHQDRIHGNGSQVGRSPISPRAMVSSVSA